MNKHVYNYDEVVIGSGLNSVIYAYLNSSKLLLTEVSGPLFFDFFDRDAEVEKLMLEPIEFVLNSPGASIVKGTPKCLVWNRLCFFLSANGQIPFSDKIYQIRIEDEETLKVTTKDSKVVTIKYNTLRMFDNKKVQGLGIPKEEIGEYKVIDWIDVKSGMKHNYDYLKSDSEFVSEAYFYPSLRIDGSAKSNKKDAVAISTLTKEQLSSFEYSDTYVKFKLRDMMKDAGIKGMRNGRDPKNSDKYKFRLIRLESKKREINKSLLSEYESKGSFIFDNRTEEEIIKETEFSNKTLFNMMKYF